MPDSLLSPYPELYGNVYDWLKEIVNNSRVVQVSPEPKPNDLEKLIKETGECWQKLKVEYKNTHISHPEYSGLLIPENMYPEFIKKFG